MYDGAGIFTRGGLVLWSCFAGDNDSSVRPLGCERDGVHAAEKERSCSLNAQVQGLMTRLVEDVLAEERLGRKEAEWEGFKIKWTVANELNLIFCVFYRGIVELSVSERVLDLLKRRLLLSVPKSVSDTHRSSATKGQLELVKLLSSEVDVNKIYAKATEAVNKGHSKGVHPLSKASLSKTEAKVSPARSDAAGDLRRQKSRKQGKEKAAWNESLRVTKDTYAKLDYSEATDDQERRELESGKYMEERHKGVSEKADESDVSDGEIDSNGVAGAEGTAGGLLSRLTAAVQSITGNKVLAESDLSQILDDLGQHLMSKNVAEQTTKEILNGLKLRLIGQRTEKFESVRSAVLTALSSTIQRILTQDRPVDVVRSILTAKSKGQVYSIVFLGVNGVGKSTNLAKVCFHLKKEGGFKVMIAACDTFRAGAVEQLRVHANNLGVYLFEQGYGKDPATIAKHALTYAANNGYDVVLIDTAGRMQDNEPLMRALAKLVALNNPDMVLFVGEALVGNDAIDQLTKFNRSLIDYAPVNTMPRGIDGILLTKFDTVDDKVGAALSMVYLTGKPVVFVGTGQMYTNLQQFKVKQVVKTLLSQ